MLRMENVRQRDRQHAVDAHQRAVSVRGGQERAVLVVADDRAD